MITRRYKSCRAIRSLPWERQRPRTEGPLMKSKSWLWIAGLSPNGWLLKVHLHLTTRALNKRMDSGSWQTRRKELQVEIGALSRLLGKICLLLILPRSRTRFCVDWRSVTNCHHLSSVQRISKLKMSSACHQKAKSRPRSSFSLKSQMTIEVIVCWQCAFLNFTKFFS